MNTIFIDIETVKCPREDLNNELVASVEAPANYVDPDKIQAYKAAKMDDIVDKTALDGTFGEIICIGFALDDEPAQVVSRSRENTEATILYEFMEKVYGCTRFRTHPRWIGHNVCFDLRFLWQRFVLNKVPMPVTIPYDANSWSPGIFDTLHQWSGKDTKNHGLEMLCKVFNLPSKPFPSESVGQLWETGQIDAVASLCAHDVEMARELYTRMTRISNPRVPEKAA